MSGPFGSEPGPAGDRGAPLIAADAALVWRARWLVPEPERVIEDGALVVERGRVVALGRADELVTRGAPVHDLGAAALTPGLVDAHAHLCLTDLAGRVPAGEAFPDWIRALMTERAHAPSDAAAAMRAGLARLAAGGCVAVGDVVAAAALGAVADEPTGAPLVRAYAEVIDAGDPARGQAAAREATRWCAAAPARRGLSPHAPYTVLDETLAALARARASDGAPLQFHWAETREEFEWTEGRGGPFEALLGPARARPAALDRLDRAGLLDARTLLVHGNHPGEDEPERIAAADASLVHCPGAHAFFDRAPFDAERYRRAGVRLCLGTDSAAGNDALDMRRELALAARAFDGVPDAELWSWATRDAARAIALDDEVGVLAVGRPFTAAAFALEVGTARDVVPALVRSEPEVVGAWVRGARIDGGRESAGRHADR